MNSNRPYTYNIAPDKFDWDAFECGDIYGDANKAMIIEAYARSKVVENEIVEGSVTSVNNREVVVTIDGKNEGVIPISEFRYNPNLAVGDKVEVYVECAEDRKDQLVLSHRKARALKSWDRVNEAFEKNEIVKGFVKSRTKGGMIADVFGLEAFLPGSQIDVKPIQDYDQFVGQTINCKIIKIDKEFRNVVVSRKVLLDAETEKKIEKDTIVTAKISLIKDFGAFADFKGGSGLIYYTQVLPNVEHGNIDTVLHEGQEVEVVVSEIKPDGKINLSMKIPSRLRRAAMAAEVKKHISELSEEDTSIRSVWMALANIEHYLLKYMQTPIMLKEGSAHLDAKGDVLAEIDSTVHFESFISEVHRRYEAEVKQHPMLKGYWYFDADMKLCSISARYAFADDCANMYVQLDADPVVELHIRGIKYEKRQIFINRLLNYYPQLRILKDAGSTFILTISYESASRKEELKIELGYAFESIRKGESEIADDGTEAQYESVDFHYEILLPENNYDRFLLTVNNEVLSDNEGVRFGSLKGKSFLATDDSGEFAFGTLKRIDYPKVTFMLNKETAGRGRNLVKQKLLTNIIPNPQDMTGEFEKVNRLSDSFDRITEHPEELVNPKLASYLFDASKATSLDENVVVARAKMIRHRQLNQSLNSSQIEAIAKAVEAKDISLIQGPPGTGKSTAIAELIWQLVLDKPDSRILLTSEANLAVDNALDRVKYSSHNIIKPIRIAAGDKFSTEGFPYSQIEMKKWAGIELEDYEIEDDDAARETKEYKDYDPSELVLCRWLRNIASRSHIDDCDLKTKWISYLNDVPDFVKHLIYNEYISHCNVIGATCSAISDTNYSATEKTQRHRDSKFYRKYKAVFGDRDKNGKPLELYFDTVIQDEASKATPSELSLPLVYGEKAVIIGDHRQLPPNLDKDDILFKLHVLKLKSSSRDEHDDIERLEAYVKKNFDVLEKSHFERLFRQIDPSIRGTFNTQYRMHKDINKVIEQFYIDDGGLNCGVDDSARMHGIDIPGLLSPDDHVIWIDTASPEIKEGTSRSNPGEAEAVKWVLDEFAKSDSFKTYLKSQKSAEDREIGLITFYGAQMKRLTPVVDTAKKNGLNIKMSSVDRFQGMERNIIIVSLVRSNTIAQNERQRPDFKRYPELGYPSQNSFGFAESPNRLNVALSRAKRLLIIVGNGTHFCSHVNREGKAIYRNVYDEIKTHPQWNYQKDTFNGLL